jgi:hypothetical protein
MLLTINGKLEQYTVLEVLGILARPNSSAEYIAAATWYNNLVPVGPCEWATILADAELGSVPLDLVPDTYSVWPTDNSDLWSLLHIDFTAGI